MKTRLGSLGVALLCAFAAGAVASAAEDAAQDAPAAAPPVEQAPTGWRTARSEAGGFSIAMPSRYRAIQAESREDGAPTLTYGLQSRRRVAFGGFAYFAVTCSDYAEEAPPPEEVFEEATGADEALGYLEYRRDHPYRGHPGIDFLRRDQRVWSYSRLYHLGSRICTLTLESPRYAKPSEEDRARFFDSFEITAR